jgi:hypothetical protein
MADADAANRTSLNNAILSTTAAARTPLTESLYEAYLYFAGRTPQWGTSTASAVVGGTVTAGRDTSAVCTAVGPDCPSIGVYRSPMMNNPTTTTPAGESPVATTGSTRTRHSRRATTRVSWW